MSFRQAAASDIELEPANVRLMIPASEVIRIRKMLSGNSQISGLGGMVSKNDGEHTDSCGSPLRLCLHQR
ncbi:MAG: hypothetical protein R3C24_19700 [Cyanobacteriota/Melainabacteria group bacterium]